MPLDGNVDLFVKPDLDAVSQTRLKAAELLERYGWCQGTSVNIHGNICMGEALHTAAGRTMGSVHLARAAAVAMGLGNRVSRWNDAHSRTLEEVLAKLREGIPR